MIVLAQIILCSLTWKWRSELLSFHQLIAELLQTQKYGTEVHMRWKDVHFLTYCNISKCFIMIVMLFRVSHWDFFLWNGVQGVRRKSAYVECFPVFAQCCVEYLQRISPSLLTETLSCIQYPFIQMNLVRLRKVRCIF